jgi:hypothetical protein
VGKKKAPREFYVRIGCRGDLERVEDVYWKSSGLRWIKETYPSRDDERLILVREVLPKRAGEKKTKGRKAK